MVLVGSVSYKTACLDTRSHRGWAIELAHKLPKRVFSSIPAFVEFERVILKQNTCVQYSQQLILLVFQLVETVYGSKPYISGASLTPQTFTFAMECHGERCVNTFDSNPSALNRLVIWNSILAFGTKMKSNLCFRNKNSVEMIRFRKRKLRQQLQPFEKIDFGQFCWFQMVERLSDYCCLLSAVSLKILTRTKNYIFWGKMHLFLISKSILNLDPPFFENTKPHQYGTWNLRPKGRGQKLIRQWGYAWKTHVACPLLSGQY